MNTFLSFLPLTLITLAICFGGFLVIDNAKREDLKAKNKHRSKPSHSHSS